MKQTKSILFALVIAATLGTYQSFSQQPATGGTVTYPNDYSVHTFNSGGTFTPNIPLTVDYLIVAGGGGGGACNSSQWGYPGGGGAGGMLTGTTNVNATAYSIVVGSGGAGGIGPATQHPGANGSNSSFNSITATGGGGGAQCAQSHNGNNGGSGGGGSFWGYGGTGIAGQGYRGSNTYPEGGGGAGGVGGASSGGPGSSSSISGSPVTYAAGGTAGAPAAGNNGAANTGNGGEAGLWPSGSGGSGGSGVVIIRYSGQPRYWVSGGDGNWGSTSNWSLTSGGAGGQPVPTSSDFVYFDGNSPACAVNTSGLAGVLNCTGYTNTITMSNGITVSGSVTLASTMTISGAGGLTVNATGTMTSNTKTWPNDLTINGTSTIALADNWTVVGALTLGSGGTDAVTLNTSTLNAQGNITVNNTSSSGGSATLNINGTGSQTMTGSSSLGSGRLPNVTINKSSGTLSLTGTITCDGDWTYTAGTVSAGTSTVAFTNTKNLYGNTMHFYKVNTYSGTRTLTSDLNVDNEMKINSGATLTQNNYAMTVGGDWTDNGTYTASSSGQITFNGSSNQTLSKSSGSETFYLVTMNKSGGTLNLSNSIIINTSLTFTLGTITTSSNNVQFIAGASTSGASTAHGFVIGNVKKVGNTAFTFPVGDGTGGYMPIGISAPSIASDEFQAKYFYTDPQAAGVYNTNRPNVSHCEYWTLARNVGTSTPTVTLYWKANHCNIASPVSLMHVAHFDGTNWVDLGSSGTGSSTNGSVATTSAVTDFSNGFALGQCGGSWVQKTDFGGSARFNAVGFSIGNYGYIGTGQDWAQTTAYGDFWRYDPSNDTWTQKANFGGTARYGAVGFSDGTYGYIGTGYDYSVGATSDFWQYNPSNNTWTQKANFGGGIRIWAVGFFDGTYGYIGTGTDGSNNLKNDFWQYNPSGDTWTQKANFGGGVRNLAVGISISSKGYIGTGADALVDYGDWWQYDPSSNSWTQKANYGGGSTYNAGAVGFTIGSYGYVGKGSTNVYYQYDPSGDTWTQVADFSCGDKYYAVGFSINGKGYVGTGEDCNGGATTKALWEFTPGTCSGGNMRMINNESSQNTIKPSGKIYPNPAMDKAILNYSFDENQRGVVELYSLMGQRIVAYELNRNEATRIDLSGVEAGIYFYVIKVNGEIKESDKLIVVK